MMNNLKNPMVFKIENDVIMTMYEGDTDFTSLGVSKKEIDTIINSDNVTINKKVSFSDLTEEDKQQLKGANGKSALEYLNENNTEFIEKIKELLPQGGEGGNSNFIDFLFPNNNLYEKGIKEEVKWKLYFVLKNFDIIEKGKIKRLQEEKGLINESSVDNTINNMTPADICSNFYKYGNNQIYFYPKYIQELNDTEEAYFNYYIFNKNNIINSNLLREFQYDEINLYDSNDKVHLLIIDMASKKSILIEIDLTNIKEKLLGINGYITMLSFSDFTEKNVNEADTFLDNYHFSRIVAQIGGDTERWRPNRYVSFNVENVEESNFEDTNRIFNNMLPE